MTIQQLMASTLSMALLLPAAGAVADDHGKADDHGNESSQAMLQLPIAGMVAAGGGIFTGTLSVQEFVARDGQVMAIGMLSGSVTNAAGARAAPPRSPAGSPTARRAPSSSPPSGSRSRPSRFPSTCRANPAAPTS